jgi:hypothetical protein
MSMFNTVRSNRFVTALAALVMSAVLMAGCSATPPAPAERDALAKEFLTHPAAATIYVYRSEFNNFDTDSILYIDGRLIGSTSPGVFFRIPVTPARHVLHGTGIDLGELALETRAGQLYIVELNVVGGISQFRLMPDRLGRERVRACCTLVESWAPTLRPLVLR